MAKDPENSHPPIPMVRLARQEHSRALLVSAAPSITAPDAACSAPHWNTETFLLAMAATQQLEGGAVRLLAMAAARQLRGGAFHLLAMAAARRLGDGGARLLASRHGHLPAHR
ncbi:unnamed protein product [Urochloa humidicola]